MYHPSEKANVLTPTRWFYSSCLLTPERYKKGDHPSRLEITILLDSCALILVLN